MKKKQLNFKKKINKKYCTFAYCIKILCFMYIHMPVPYKYLLIYMHIQIMLNCTMPFMRFVFFIFRLKKIQVSRAMNYVLQTQVNLIYFLANVDMYVDQFVYGYNIFTYTYCNCKHEICRETLSRCGAQFVNSFNSDYITDYR